MQQRSQFTLGAVRVWTSCPARHSFWTFPKHGFLCCSDSPWPPVAELPALQRPRGPCLQRCSGPRTSPLTYGVWDGPQHFSTHSPAHTTPSGSAGREGEGTDKEMWRSDGTAWGAVRRFIGGNSFVSVRQSPLFSSWRQPLSLRPQRCRGRRTRKRWRDT